MYKVEYGRQDGNSYHIPKQIRGMAICVEGERRKTKLEAWIKDKAWNHTNGGAGLTRKSMS